MPTMTILRGLPGSGKSTIAAQLADATRAQIISPDSIREEILGDAALQQEPLVIFAVAHVRAVLHLRSGVSIIIDATNIRRSEVRAWIALAQECGNVDVVIETVATPLEECRIRNAQRSRQVPDEVICTLAAAFEPLRDEDFVIGHQPVVVFHE